MGACPIRHGRQEEPGDYGHGEAEQHFMRMPDMGRHPDGEFDDETAGEMNANPA